jgi:dephospho-CoA kinase
MLRVGLTGGIACGKSHVLARLAEAGCHTIDLDRVAHETMAPGQPAHAEIVEWFGREVLAGGGAIDRKALGERVFSDGEARRRLNAIVHPRVRAEEARRAAAWQAEPASVVVTDAALLVESGVHLRFERLVVVHCTPEEQIDRLMRRDGSERAAAQARIAAQMPLAEKRRYAHLEVDTSGRHRDTDLAAGRLAAELGRLAASRPGRSPVARQRALGCLAHGPSQGPGRLGSRQLLDLIVASGGVEMAELASAMGREGMRPWYEPEASGTHPAALTGPLVLYALARLGPDAEFLASAAASLARLFQRQGAVVAETCLFALALADLAGGRPLEELPAIADAWRPLALKWGGGAPSARFEALLRAAPDASRASGLIEEDRALARTLRGMARGPEGREPDPGLVEALEALEHGLT